MGALQPIHLIVILVIVLVVFGAGRLPEVGGALGKGIRDFRASAADKPNGDPAPSGTGFCASCGARIAKPDARFCEECGAPIAR